MSTSSSNVADSRYEGTATRDTRTAAARPLSDPVVAPMHDAVLLVARVLLGYTFVLSGFAKLMDLGVFTASLASKGVPMASVLGVVGACAEFFGGLAIVLGVATPYAALLLFLFTLVATAISHRFWEATGAAFRPQVVNFEKNTAIMGGFLLLFLLGGGRLSVDRWLRLRA